MLEESERRREADRIEAERKREADRLEMEEKLEAERRRWQQMFTYMQSLGERMGVPPPPPEMFSSPPQRNVTPVSHLTLH